MIGTPLSRFKITAKLGEGGMGEVYRAEELLAEARELRASMGLSGLIEQIGAPGDKDQAGELEIG